MARNGGKRGRAGEGKGTAANSKLDDDIDALFRLPLADFTSARNALATKLKKEGRANEAERAKLLAKPSISVWAVNQLYWNHSEAFDELIAAGERIREGQTSRNAGKVASMRESLDDRRESLAHLSNLATALLLDAGHNPAPDTMRRITTTLEAISAYALLPDDQTPGRLTHDLDPPSFDALSAMMSGTGKSEAAKGPLRIAASSKLGAPPANRQQKTTTNAEVRRLEAARQAKLAEAKSFLQEAKRSLVDARGEAQDLEAAGKKANADAKVAEKFRREAEVRLEEASNAAEAASRRAQTVANDVKEAMKAVEDAKRAVENATKELETLLRAKP